MDYSTFGYVPFQKADIVTGVRRPSAVHHNSYAYNFWFRALTQRVLSIIKFDLPDNWNRARDLFEYTLFFRGYVAVFDAPEFGISFQPCTTTGYDFYYQPTKAVIANPLYNAELEIGKECEIIKLTPDCYVAGGIGDIINYFAEKLANLDSAEDMAITNSKLAYVLAAKNKSSAQGLKMIFDKINAGEPTIIYDKKLIESLGEDEPFEFLDRQSVKNSYLTSDILKDFQTIINQFDAEIGIPTLGAAEKKERMITDEANSKNADTSARVSLWDESLSESIKAVNRMFGINISYQFVFLDQIQEMNEPDEMDPGISAKLKEWGMI